MAGLEQIAAMPEPMFPSPMNPILMAYTLPPDPGDGYPRGHLTATTAELNELFVMCR